MLLEKPPFIFDPKPTEPEFMDLNNFKDSEKLVQPILDRRVLTTLTTVKFSELDVYYQSRDAGTLKKDTVKPIFGQLLEFADLRHFIAGIPAGSYPKEIKVGEEFTGVAVNDGKLFTCNRNQVEIFHRGNRSVFTHPLFNDLRFIDFSKDGTSMLVCSSGTDSLLEFTYPGFQLSWTWFAPDHGYIAAPDGTLVATNKVLETNQLPDNRPVRVLDDGTDYSKQTIETTSQSSHINSCRYLDDGAGLISATLYQGGEAVLINKKTGKTEKVMSGISRPHGFFNFGENGLYYVITGAKSGLIEILDHDLNHIFTVNGEIKRFISRMTWIQNAYPVGGNLLAAIDHYNRRLVFFDVFKQERYIVNTHHEWKIFQFLVGGQNQNIPLNL